MSFTLAELTKNLEVSIHGDPQCRITGIATIESAKEGQLTFLSNPLYKKHMATTQASAVILSPQELTECRTNAIVAKNPYYIYAQIAAYFILSPKIKNTIHATAVIGEDCHLGKNISIGPQVVLGDRVRLGDHVTLGPGCVIGDNVSIASHTALDAHVTLYHGVMIGAHCVLASGVVVGSDGFGLAPHQGRWYKVPQLGSVQIKDFVEIGANTCIDRGAIENTIIEEGVKLDNLIQIGHNVRIGAHTVIAGCTGVAGSTQIGQHCVIAGGVGIAGHISITDRVTITGMGMVTKSITTSGVYSSGTGLQSQRDWQKMVARLHRLDTMAKQIRQLSKKE